MDRLLNLLSTIVKTIITMLLAFLAGAAVFAFFDDKSFAIIAWVVGIAVFWVLCPGDTKNWLKNWTKPSNPQKK